jgi:hypothetical protein
VFYIYGLYLEGDEEIRYVGSSCEPHKRLRQHLCGDSKNPAKDTWIAENRPRIRMRVLATADERNRHKEEERAILECRGKGHRLLNERRASRKAATAEDVAWWLDHIEGEKSPF